MIPHLNNPSKFCFFEFNLTFVIECNVQIKLKTKKIKINTKIETKYVCGMLDWIYRLCNKISFRQKKKCFHTICTDTSVFWSLKMV